MTGEKVVLNDEDLAIVQRLQSGKYPTGEDQFKVKNFNNYVKIAFILSIYRIRLVTSLLQ